MNHPDIDQISGFIHALPACGEGAEAASSKAFCEHSPDAARSTTLHNLLQNCRGGRLQNGLPVPERLRLARIVTVAYFRFHSTGWANSGWKSNSICFQWTNKDDWVSEATSLHMPYLQSRIYSGSSYRISNVSQSPPTGGLSTASIFNLGVLLLGIGFSMNWETLDNVHPNQYGNNDQLSAVLQARTLLANGLFDMGRTYRKIVSKLVECAFSNVYDLDDPKHEAAFLEAVIEPLEEEERKLEAFLGPSRSS